MAEDIASVMSRILEHPELVEQIAKAVKGEENDGENAEKSDTPPAVPTVAAVGELLGKLGNSSHGGGGNAPRGRYLAAIRPCVNPRRAQAIDAMNTVLRILGGIV